jgi:SOS-response transcriptional repressor LexA
MMQVVPVPASRAPALIAAAGALADVPSLPETGDVPTLTFADLGRGSFFALRVAGDSMDRISPDQSIIIVNQADRTLVPGRFYVFSQRGQATYKRWHANPDYLAPYSTNPMNEPILVAHKREFAVVGRVRRTVLDL